jgi:hypothetical protein
MRSSFKGIVTNLLLGTFGCKRTCLPEPLALPGEIVAGSLWKSAGRYRTERCKSKN